MSIKGRKRRTIVDQRSATDLVVLAGLPRFTSRRVRDILFRDTSKRNFRFEGAPSTKDDSDELYGPATLANLQEIVSSTVSNQSSVPVPNPRRILVLYVPSEDSERLFSALGFTCYMEPLVPSNPDPGPHTANAWRHDIALVLDSIYPALERATAATEKLKYEITDKGRSPLALPAQNFYFPDGNTAIRATYLRFAKQELSIEELNEALRTRKFTREQLPTKVLRGSGNTVRYFQDERGRVFPPDGHHAPSRYPEEGETSEQTHTLRQRYRFGVVVRDGHIHYDVQYENPGQLHNELMHCAIKGEVLVTGSHANVGVNDVVWAPDGRVDPVDRPQRN